MKRVHLHDMLRSAGVWKYSTRCGVTSDGYLKSSSDVEEVTCRTCLAAMASDVQKALTPRKPKQPPEFRGGKMRWRRNQHTRSQA